MPFITAGPKSSDSNSRFAPPEKSEVFMAE